MTQAVKNKKPTGNLHSEFYTIPLLGEVRLVFSDESYRPHSIGEIINNYRRTDSRTITMRALDDGLSREGILNGDFLTIDLRISPDDGDIVVVKIGYRIYVRKFFRERDLIRLETSSATPSPLIVDPRIPGFELIGKVVTIIREL
jgi:SOS-response transcriptional repressor LexA